MTYINNTYYELREDVTLNTTDFPTSTLVSEWITQASKEIDRDLKRSFLLGDYTDVIKESENRLPSQLLFVKNTPINSLTSVTRDVNRNAFDPNFQPIPAVILDSETGMIKVQSPLFSQEVRVSYNGGYDSDDYPEELKYLCYLIVKRIQTDTELRQEIGDDTTTSISSITVRERSSSNLKNKLDRLDSQIQELKSKLNSNVYVGTY